MIGCDDEEKIEAIVFVYFSSNGVRQKGKRGSFFDLAPPHRFKFSTHCAQIVRTGMTHACTKGGGGAANLQSAGPKEVW